MMLLADLQVIYERDPAARNWLEVLFCYPGLQALLLHRLAHFLYRLQIPLIPRLISQISRFFTGIEIHPGAQLGRGVFIDHGMGVVIGETAIVGDYCLIYQDATLGGTGKEQGKRHPTLGNNVVVGAGAKVLGNIEIGDNVRIGAGSVVLRNVPSDVTVVGVPGRIIREPDGVADTLAHNALRDVEAEVIRALFDRLKELEDKMQELKGQSGVPASLITNQAVKASLEQSLNSQLFSHSNGNSHSNLQIRTERLSSQRNLVRQESDRLIEDFLDGAGI